MPILILFLLITFAVNPAYPAKIISHPIEQGKTLAVSSVSAAARGEFLGHSYRFYPEAKGEKVLLPILPDQPPGTYPLIIKDKEGNQLRKQSVKVVKYHFPSVSFWLKPAKKQMLSNRNLINNEWAEVENRLRIEDPVAHWRGKFILPAEGEISMQFGTIEYVNRRRGGQHRGTDIAVPTGTNVLAANDGTVVFAKVLKAFGGTMAVDHGQGVFSLYFHLSRFIAPVGTKVSKGQLIALSGSSGIASGPHLHWGMSVHNVRVNPLQWMETEL